MQYRADIDGLRAISVLSVIVFHANFGILPGGFVGVDIFFVISGFLITKIILDNKRPIGSFLKIFYERRIRRLIPPAIPVIIFVFICGYIYLPPDELRELSQSIIAYAAFVSNWFFLSEAGYFDGPSHMKPLLHTWSLSVEEQFYLIFPWLVLLLGKRKSQQFSTSKIPQGLLVKVFYFSVFLLSFFYGLYLLQAARADNAFFNAFARFWEIALGGMLACGVFPQVRNSIFKHILSAVGLILILCAIVFIDETMVFPGKVALVPVIGAGLVIHANGGFAAKILSIRPLTAIGLISYAMYLWHWPIFVYLKYAFIAPQMPHYLAAIALTIALSTLSYHIIERPVRTGKILRTSMSIFVAFAVATAITVTTAYILLKTEKHSQRFASAEDYSSHLSSQLRAWTPATRRGKCLIGGNRQDFSEIVEPCITYSDSKANILILGDSHAAHLLPGLENTYAGVNFSILASNSCPLVKSGSRPRPSCDDLVDWIDKTNFSKFDAVFISTRNMAVRPSNDFMERLTKISQTTKVVVFGPVPFYQPSHPTLFPSVVGKLRDEEIAKQFNSALSDQPVLRDKGYRKAFNEPHVVQYISMIDVICPNNECQHFDDDGWPILIDKSHLSIEASTLFVARLSNQLPFLSNRKDRPHIFSKNFRAAYKGDVQEGRVKISGTEFQVQNDLSWSPQANAKLKFFPKRNAIEFEFPKDGRMRRILKFKHPIDIEESVTFTFNAKLALTEPNENIDILLIMQNGCEHIVHDGVAHDIQLKNGNNDIRRSVELSAPVSCLMIRLWSKNAPIKGVLRDITITVTD